MGKDAETDLQSQRSRNQGHPGKAAAAVGGAIHGALNFYKPRGITSAKALYRVRKIIGLGKSGHAGTLDPAAEGVLVLCLGQGTKLTEAWMDQPKVYRATARLDITSESFDTDGEVTEVQVERRPTARQIRAALAQFVGHIQQTPPSISAIKVNGQPAYRSARRGQPLVLKARGVHIHWLHLHAYCWPVVDLEMACGRGTYVRALIRDLGKVLETGGCLSSLTRTAVGPFRASEGWTYETLEAEGSGTRWLTSLDDVRSKLARRPVAIPPAPVASDSDSAFGCPQEPS